MKNQQQAQKIFNILADELARANGQNLFYVTKKLDLKNWRAKIDTPLEHFLKSTREHLTEKDVSEEFLRRVYAEAFHTGPIPKNRNHIAMTCDLQVNSGPTSPVLFFWIDLDKVATQLNAHLQINPPYRFKVEYHARSFTTASRSSDGDNLIKNTSSAVNPGQNRLPITNFLLACLMNGVSVYALLIAALAVASIISLSSAGIFTAAGVGLVAGVASYCFFKASSGLNKTVSPIKESKSENIEDIFRNHFAATIDMTILPEDRVEIIDDEQALGI